MNLPKHERPSGLLNKDATMMELVGVVLDGKGTNIQCKRWVPVTKEQLDSIQGATVGIASVGFVLDDKTHASILNDSTTYRLDQCLDLEAVTPSEEVKLVTDLKIDSFSMTTDGIGLRGSGTLKGEVHPGYPKDAVQVSITGMPDPRDNGEYMVAYHVLDDVLRAVGSPVYLHAKDFDGSLNLRDLAREHAIDFFKLFSAFNKAMNPLAVSSDLPKAGTPAAAKPEHSGHNVNYYSVEITHPKRPEREPYTFEVEDLIQALNLGFHEGTILKSLVRSATERELGLLKQGGDAVRDAEKMVHSSQELLRARKLQRGK